MNFSQLGFTLTMGASGFRQEDVFTLEEWTSVLKLSTMWDFVTIREFAIAKIAPLLVDAVDKVVLARDYHVDEWLLPGLNSLAQRVEPLSLGDYKRLGAETAVEIAAIRESAVYNSYYETWELRDMRGPVSLDFTQRIVDLRHRAQQETQTPA